MESLQQASDVLFILLGAVMVLAMHAGFAFLELGTVRHKNQVNALVKIMVDFSMSTIAYFFIGYGIAYGIGFLQGAETLAAKNGYQLVKFFFLLTFAAASPQKRPADKKRSSGPKKSHPSFPGTVMVPCCSADRPSVAS